MVEKKDEWAPLFVAKSNLALCFGFASLPESGAGEMSNPWHHFLFFEASRSEKSRGR